MIEIDFLTVDIYDALLPDRREVFQALLLCKVDVMVTGDKVYATIQLLEDFAPARCWAVGEITKVKDNPVFRDCLVPSANQLCIHLFRAFEGTC